jgi:DNA-binding MurR/RpiR family transcriptional regulator
VIALLEDSCYPSLLVPNIESHSSINIIEGFFSLANPKRALIVFSASPTYFETISAAEILKKVA